MQDFPPFQFWRTIAIISHIQLLCSCFLLLLKTIQQPFLPLWSMAHKDLWHHSWTIPGNAKHLMLKIHPWCGSAAQFIITQLGLTRVNNFGPGMEQQSQPNPTFLVWNIDPRSKFFPFLFWWWQNEDPPLSTHLFLTSWTRISLNQGHKQNCWLPLPSKTEVQVWKGCKPSQGSQSLTIQTPWAFQAKFRHFRWCWKASFSRGCTTSAWACELDSGLTGLFEFAIIPKCILVNNTQFSIHHLLFESN